MSIFTGSGVAIVTPFNETGVDFKKLEELLNWHIEKGTDAIVVCGTTGEASTMSETERKETIKFTVDVVKGRIPVIAGTGSNNTATSVEMSKWAESIGVDGLLVITPYYNKTTQAGCIKHFEAVATNVNIPIIVYNVPSRTGLNIQPSTLVEIAKLPNILAIKEASGDISQIAEIARVCPNLDIYSGNDDQIVPIMSLGGKGVISVVANILPTETHDICAKYLSGDTKAALALQLEMLPLINSLFIECNPIPVKAALNILGKNVGSLRLPLVDMSDSGKEILLKAIKDYGLNA
ncbi:4-hydroxy-tetrahydrodipicolinate synthase [Clostridium cylindrosporum]|uniref:4-hydroxy-tetrahydrodipicolinate synthase n=1 Tax=Clostridium cylindrosporum DSM 605 TaxID=1121307 RepID=A0A0J8DA05_CLOCY|nr:4-hydroxy-tetrahydrodipicolinate synthase [Clostridium cylindrosporum]KMT22677.1 4-hydroxy-tetrahydrodipicolinate synthase DapA [Clostridium cylindrosporum DSM 605]